MIGAIQVGALASTFVIITPLILAGYHLSRNKVLFFSGALFISLAVFVHLSPHFPTLLLHSLSSPLSPSSPHLTLPSPSSCLSLLHVITFHPNPNTSSHSFSWRHHPHHPSCDFHHLGPTDTRILLNGSWVLVAGDSQARLFTLSFLNLILQGKDEGFLGEVRRDLFKRHSDYSIEVKEIGLRVDFVWAPYVSDLGKKVDDLRENGTYPDVFIMGSGLWHMLHVTNASNYGEGLSHLRGKVEGMKRMMPVQVFWIGMPRLVNAALNTEEKRERMTEAREEEYELEVRSSGILRGGVVLLDVRLLSEECGVGCTVDGMHYHEVVYEAAVHVMLNALLIESQQRLKL